MPTDKLDLERRIALTSPGDQVRGLSFAAVLELVERHCGPRVAGELRAPVGRRLVGFFNYPAADFLRLTFAAADALEPHLGSIDAAFREMGRAAASALTATPVGKTLTNFVRGNPPNQVLRYAPTAYGMAVTFGTRTVAPVDASSAKVTLDHDFMPAPYHVGIFQSGLDTCGVRASIEGMTTALDASELLIRWN